MLDAWDMLGLVREGPGRATFELTSPLARFDGKLFGGTAVAVAVALAEAETDRPAIWTTVQFIDGTTTVGDRFDCSTEVLALGRSAAQVRVRAHVDDREVFCALAATALPKSGRPEAAFTSFPEVTAPDESAAFLIPLPSGVATRRPERRLIELRNAAPAVGAARGDRLTIWARIEGRGASPAVIGFLADMVPLAVARAARRAGGGSSIDITMRFGARTESDWVLLELDPHFATGGYGHGTVLVWSPDGQLVATGSQTTSLILFD